MDAADRLGTLDQCAVLAFSDTEASTAGFERRSEVQAVPTATTLKGASSDLGTWHLGIKATSVGSGLTVEGIQTILLGLVGQTSPSRC